MSRSRSREYASMSRRPRFDRLEPRLVLSSDGDWPAPDPADPPIDSNADTDGAAALSCLTVGLLSPAPGSSATSSPDSLLLEFNRPIVSDSMYQDVILYRVSPGGDVEWYYLPESLALDASAARLTVDVPVTLAPGSYQVWIVAYCGIMDPDGVYLSPDGEPLELGTFDVVQPGVTLDETTDLGSIGGNPLVVQGTLDFSSDPFAVSLYRIELDPGHFWRLGLEVTAERDGGSLDSALGLFDAQGRAIASNDYGRFGTPKDPYLFAGLEPGTYFVGVSGVGNLAGTDGGYDPASGSPGVAGQAQPGGDFRLHLVADAVDAPPSVVSLTLDHADPKDPSPTGFTLGFSRILAVPGFAADPVHPASTSIVVAGPDGREWPVVEARFSEPESRISYVFNDSLPAGRYEVKLVDAAGLVDLAGLAPVASGQPAGVLGVFEVTTGPSTRSPEDLGAIFPGEADDGVTVELLIPSGQSSLIRFVVTAAGVYSLIRPPDNDPASVVLLRPEASYALPQQFQNDVELERGEYFLRFTNAGGDPIHEAITLALSKLRAGEIILSNGVGQTPALSLRLIEFSGPQDAPLPFEPTPIVSGPLFPGSSGAPDDRGWNQAPIKPGPIADPVSAIARVDWLTRGATGGLSLIGWSTDLSGRPEQEVGRAQRRMWASTDAHASPASSRRGWGQSIAAPSSRRDLPADGQDASTEILDQVPARGPLKAAMVEIDLKQAVAAAVRLQQWAVRQGTIVSLWFRNWPSWRSRSWLARLPLALSAPGTEALRAGLETEDGRVASEHANSGQLESTSAYLRPPVVALSVAALAQAGWRLGRWWRSRRRIRPATPWTSSGRATIDPGRSAMGVWTSASPMALSMLRRSHGR